MILFTFSQSEIFGFVSFHFISFFNTTTKTMKKAHLIQLFLSANFPSTPYACRHRCHNQSSSSAFGCFFCIYLLLLLFNPFQFILVRRHFFRALVFRSCSRHCNVMQHSVCDCICVCVCEREKGAKTNTKKRSSVASIAVALVHVITGVFSNWIMFIMVHVLKNVWANAIISYTFKCGQFLAILHILCTLFLFAIASSSFCHVHLFWHFVHFDGGLINGRKSHSRKLAWN